MKIHINADRHHLRFCFPTWLIFNKTAARIANTVGRKYAPDAMKHIPPEALEALCTELGNIKKRYGAWELVTVESANGEIVQVIL